MKTMMWLAAVGTAFWAGCTTVQKPAYDTLICHRGESKDAPENTLPAYRMAVDRGFGFECDIYLSKDKRLFTFHDGNLKRTTGGVHTEKCTAASWEETVSKVNVGGWGKWKGSRFDPTRPALLPSNERVGCADRHNQSLPDLSSPVLPLPDRCARCHPSSKANLSPVRFPLP